MPLNAIFIESDVNAANEIIEGIVGTPPPQNGFNYTQEGIQFLEKLGNMQKKWFSYKSLMNHSKPLVQISIAWIPFLLFSTRGLIP